MSVGHVSRVLEESGIATVIIAVRAFRDQLEAMTVPRAVITPQMMGRALGSPGDADGQRASILAGFDLLECAERAGTIIDLTAA